MRPRRSLLEPEAVPVVLVDDPGRDVSAVDGRDDRLLVLVDARVPLAGPRARRPPPSRRGSRSPHRRSAGSPSRAARPRPCRATPASRGRGSTPGAAPPAPASGRRRGCSRGAPSQPTVPRASGRRPAPAARATWRGGARSAVLLEVHQLGRVLGQIDVGRGRAALLQDLVGEHDAVVRPHVNVDTGLLLECGDQRPGQLEVLAVVEDDRDPCRRSPRSAAARRRQRPPRSRPAAAIARRLHACPRNRQTARRPAADLVARPPGTPRRAAAP